MNLNGTYCDVQDEFVNHFLSRISLLRFAIWPPTSVIREYTCNRCRLSIVEGLLRKCPRQYTYTYIYIRIIFKNVIWKEHIILAIVIDVH